MSAVLRLPVRVACFVVLAASAMMAAPQPPRLEIVPLVGRWVQTVEAGEAVVTADPREWDGKSGPDLQQLATSLFTRPNPEIVKNLAPATAYPLAVVTSVDGFSAGTLRIRFKLIGGESDQTAGLAFAIAPAGDFLYVRYNTKDGNVAVWEFVNGARRVLAHGADHRQLPLGTWHDLAVTVSGNRLTGVVDNLRVEHELDRAVAGRIGFWAKRDAISSFSSLQVAPASK